MAVTFTTTKFLSDLKRSAHIPTNQNTFTDSQLLDLADSELQTLVLPQILRVQENYLLASQDYSINSSGVYEIPDRAIGMKLADVQLIVGTNIAHMKFMDLSQQDATIGSPLGDYAIVLLGNRFEILPAPTQGILRAYYYMRPGKMTAVSAAARITGFGPNPGEILVSSYPSTMSAGIEVDAIQDRSGFSTLATELELASVAPGILTLTTEVPSDLSIGDYISLSGETPIPQLPVELQQLLVQASVVKIYEIQGYLDKMKAAAGKLEKMQEDLMALITPRVVEAPRTILSPNNSVLNTNWIGRGRFRSW